MANSAASPPQNEFINAARKEHKRVEIFLVNGIRLTGCIESFDQYLVMLRTPVGLQGIYKRAISTIQLDTGGVRSGSSARGSRPGAPQRGSAREPRADSYPPREPRYAAHDEPEVIVPPPKRPADGPVIVVKPRRVRRPVGNE